MSGNSLLTVVGAWGLLDHFLAMESLPADGETVRTLPGSVPAGEVFFGDCSGNIAAVAAAMGSRVRFVTVAGRDFESSGYGAHLRKLGVDLRGVTILPDLLSGHNYNCFSPDGGGFCITQQGAAARQSPEMIREEWFADAACTVICEAFSPYTLRAAEAAKDAGGTVVLSGMVGDRNPLWEDFLRLADLLFINRSEYGRLLELAGAEADLFTRFGLRALFITCGAEGARVITPDGAVAVPVVPAPQVTDPTGAGDAFVAGTVSALLRGFPPARAALLGAAASSFVIEDFGCQTRLPDWEGALERIKSAGKEDLLYA